MEDYYESTRRRFTVAEISSATLRPEPEEAPSDAIVKPLATKCYMLPKGGAPTTTRSSRSRKHGEGRLRKHHRNTMSQQDDSMGQSCPGRELRKPANKATRESSALSSATSTSSFEIRKLNNHHQSDNNLDQQEQLNTIIGYQNNANDGPTTTTITPNILNGLTDVVESEANNQSNLNNIYNRLQSQQNYLLHNQQQQQLIDSYPANSISNSSQSRNYVRGKKQTSASSITSDYFSLSTTTTSQQNSPLTQNTVNRIGTQLSSPSTLSSSTASPKKLVKTLAQIYGNPVFNDNDGRGDNLDDDDVAPEMVIYNHKSQQQGVKTITVDHNQQLASADYDSIIKSDSNNNYGATMIKSTPMINGVGQQKIVVSSSNKVCDQNRLRQQLYLQNDLIQSSNSRLRDQQTTLYLSHNHNYGRILQEKEADDRDDLDYDDNQVLGKQRIENNNRMRRVSACSLLTGDVLQPRRRNETGPSKTTSLAGRVPMIHFGGRASLQYNHHHRGRDHDHHQQHH